MGFLNILEVPEDHGKVVHVALGLEDSDRKGKAGEALFEGKVLEGRFDDLLDEAFLALNEVLVDQQKSSVLGVDFVVGLHQVGFDLRSGN